MKESGSPTLSELSLFDEQAEMCHLEKLEEVTFYLGELFRSTDSGKVVLVRRENVFEISCDDVDWQLSRRLHEGTRGVAFYHLAVRRGTKVKRSITSVAGTQGTCHVTPVFPGELGVCEGGSFCSCHCRPCICTPNKDSATEMFGNSYIGESSFVRNWA